MPDFVSMILAVAIIYGVLTIFVLLLVMKLYRSRLVRGVKTSTYYPNASNEGDHVTSRFTFMNQRGEKINCETGGFTLVKDGKTKLFFYNDDQNQIISSIYTIVWQSLICIVCFIYLIAIDLLFFVLGILLILLVIRLYIKSYKRKYFNKKKN